MKKDKYKIETINGLDYVTVSDAKKILGVASAKELRSIGACTHTPNGRKPLWNLDWIISYSHEGYFNPDMEWIEEYEKNLVASDTRPRKRLSAKRPRKNETLTTSKRLKDLMKLMPPPKNVRNNSVDWDAVEKAVGVEYPKSYKDFIKVYGSLEWCGVWWPIVPCDRTPEQFKEHLGRLIKQIFGRNPVDANGELLFVPEFGTTGFWLPFMVGCDGDSYAWLVHGPPERWSVIIFDVCKVVAVIPPISIVEMFLGWLKDEQGMKNFWGSFEEFREHSPDLAHQLR